MISSRLNLWLWVIFIDYCWLGTIFTPSGLFGFQNIVLSSELRTPPKFQENWIGGIGLNLSLQICSRHTRSKQRNRSWINSFKKYNLFSVLTLQKKNIHIFSVFEPFRLINFVIVNTFLCWCTIAYLAWIWTALWMKTVMKYGT